MLDQIEKKILDIIDSKKDEIIAFGTDIFQHAELGFKEERTSGKFVEKMKELGLVPVTLGSRILRCETAPLAAASIIMNLTGNM